jgi:phage/plasmid primase-like uncharacterized protein
MTWRGYMFFVRYSDKIKYQNYRISHAYISRSTGSAAQVRKKHVTRRKLYIIWDDSGKQTYTQLTVTNSAKY